MHPVLEVDYFDGRVSRARPARLHVGADRVRLDILESGAPRSLEFSARDVQWAERVRHGARVARLPEGQSIRAKDPEAWDAVVLERQGVVSRMQQSWRSVLGATVLLMGVVFGLYRWGLPAAARAVTPMIPAAVDRELGQSTLAHLEGTVFKPTELSAETRERLSLRLNETLRRLPDIQGVEMRLEFRKSRIGPNAVALPGGTIVVTDELVKLVNDDVVLGVIGHELGHVQHRHGMRQLVQVTAMQAVLSVAVGDYGSFLTAAPLVIGAMGYSRDHEREADEASVRFMRAAGISPAVMAGFFEKVSARRQDKEQERPVGISILSSHPDDAERIAYFRRMAESH
jgi:Zn-dependent protease with chaperone function